MPAPSNVQEAMNRETLRLFALCADSFGDIDRLHCRSARARPHRNARTRPAPKKPAPVVEDEDDDEDEEEKSGSNTFLIIILVLLILALLAVSAYIGWTKIIKPRQAGSDNNKPQETITAQVDVTTAPTEVTTEPEEQT